MKQKGTQNAKVQEKKETPRERGDFVVVGRRNELGSCDLLALDQKNGARPG